jgi:AP-3 complex subunit delta-1|tara:strand:+ start:1425 stop:4520 length:3096 start_codon:yes stop_codon:yes gene_type:complete
VERCRTSVIARVAEPRRVAHQRATPLGDTSHASGIATALTSSFPTISILPGPDSASHDATPQIKDQSLTIFPLVPFPPHRPPPTTHQVISPDIRTKAVAIEKATYLHSLGFNMTWASFHVVELMSCTNVKYKRVGYLAATQSFGDDTDVVLLIPNLLKKDLASPNPAEAALAISCLGNIVTPELSQTLVADVYSLLNNHKPELRRRACLCLYKCFLRYPEALRPSFARLTECLEDDDQTVVQAAVTVLAELAMHNPKTYLPLAPKFYKLLTTSSSNWMTIKLVKVFGALTPLEPRLAKKLVGPLSEILETTSAKSLLYECIRTVVAGMTSQEKIVRQAVDKLKDMLEDNDPNIKYLALHALTFLLESHPRIVAEHKGNIFMCVDHEDSNIQYCALKIVRGLVTKKTLMDTTAHLMGAMGKADQRFRDELVWSVIHVCMNDRYALVTDFVWYLTVLADLTKVPSSAHGGLVGDQLVDICLRVEVVRESAVAILKPLLLDPALLENTPSNATVPEALKSIAWIIGEYAHFITDVDEVVEALSSPNVTNLPAHVQAVYVQSLLKVYASAVATHAGAVRPPPAAPEPAQAPFDETAPPVVLALAAPGEEGDDAFAAERAAAAAAAAAPKRKPQPDTPMPRSDVLVPMSPSLARLGESIKENLVPFSVSLHLEVRERACQLTTILDIASAAEAHNPGEGVAIIEQFALVLSEEVQPVSLKAQRKIEPPACLSIKEPLSTQWDSLLVSSGDDDSGDDEEETRAGRKGSKKKNRKHKDVTDLFAQKKSKAQILQEEQEAREMLKRHREKMGNYYLGGEVPAKPPVSVEEGGKKNKKGKKGTVEALPPVPSPAEQEMPAYMKASMAGVKMARPAIKGESDSDSDDDDARENEKGFGKKALYAPKNSSAALHAGLGGYDPLKPLGRGEEMPSVAAYPEYDPYANQGGGAGGTNAFSVPQQGDRRKKEKKSKREKSTSKDEARAKHEARKASKKENEGEEKKPKKEKKGKEPTKEKEKGEKKEKKAKKGDKLASKMEKVSV